jgi:hypothetical protein
MTLLSRFTCRNVNVFITMSSLPKPNSGQKNTGLIWLRIFEDGIKTVNPYVNRRLAGFIPLEA